MNEIVRAFAKKQGYTKLIRADDWRGYKVYTPVYDEVLYIGLPYVILFDGKTARLSTVDESLERVQELPE